MTGNAPMPACAMMLFTNSRRNTWCRDKRVSAAAMGCPAYRLWDSVRAGVIEDGDDPVFVLRGKGFVGEDGGDIGTQRLFAPLKP